MFFHSGTYHIVCVCVCVCVTVLSITVGQDCFCLLVLSSYFSCQCVRWSLYFSYVYSPCCGKHHALKSLISTKIYKKWPTDMLETLFNFNIIFLTILTWYNLEEDRIQSIITYISSSASLTMVLVIVSYHLYTYTTIVKLGKRVF